MTLFSSRALINMLRAYKIKIIRANDPTNTFHSHHYLRHNARRLEHLASLQLELAKKTVLEVGAGIGDHSHYFLDRDCKLTITEARKENLKYLYRRYPGEDVRPLDMESPTPINGAPFDVVYCYGLLYHLSDPEKAIKYLSEICKNVLLVETCVSFGNGKEINIIKEDIIDKSQACSGKGCRPTRPWIFEKLKDQFQFVYIPTTQPNHEEFPINWESSDEQNSSLSRAIFIASRRRIDNINLTSELLNKQVRHW